MAVSRTGSIQEEGVTIPVFHPDEEDDTSDNEPLPEGGDDDGVVMRTCAGVRRLTGQGRRANEPALVTTIRALKRLAARGDRSDPRRARWAEGLCSVVGEALRAYPASRRLVIECADVMCEVGGHRAFWARLTESGALEGLVTSARRLPTDAGVQEALCRFVIAVAFKDHTQQRVDMGATGVCEHLVSTYRTFPHHRMLKAMIWNGVTALALETDNSRRMGAAGVCTILANYMRDYASDVDCQIDAGGAARNLAYDVAENREAMGAAGVGEALIGSLQRFGAMEELAEDAVGAISGMCESNVGNCSRLGAGGACECIVRAMRDHPTADALQEECVGGIRRLCLEIEDNRNRLGDLGAAELIVAACRAFAADADLVEESIGAMQHMCLHHARNVERFIAAGGIEVLVDALNEYQLEAKVIRVCCGAIHVMARSSPAAREVFRTRNVQGVISRIVRGARMSADIAVRSAAEPAVDAIESRRSSMWGWLPGSSR